MTQGKYNYKGDYVLNKIDLTNNEGIIIDLIPLFLEINVFESIFDNTMSGNVVITDTQGLFDTLGITGGEKIELSFYTAGKEESLFEKEFMVSSLNDAIAYNQATYVYTLGFVSPEEYKNSVNVVNEAYSGTISDIATTIFSKLESEKEFNVEETKLLNDFIFPYWKPFDALNWLTKRSLSSEKERTGFLFFENKEGFNFRSIQSLYRSDSDLEYTYQPSSEEEIDNYIDFELNDPNFLLEKLYNGSLFANKQVFDLYTGTIKSEEENYINNFSDINSLDKISMPVEYEYDNYKANNICVMKDSGAKTNCDMFEENIFKFKSILSQSNNSSVTIKAPGNTDVTVGYNARCKILKSMAKDEIKFCDFFYRNMLISEIRHTIKGESYYQTITLIKDSYGENYA